MEVKAPYQVSDLSYLEAYQSVGDDIHAYYQACGHQMSEGGWKIARTCLLTIDNGIPRMHAYKIAATDAQVSVRKVTDYVRCVEQFAPEEVEYYSQFLGICFFTTCLRSPFDPHKALAWALRHRASIDYLEAIWVFASEPPPEEDEDAQTLAILPVVLQPKKPPFWYKILSNWRERVAINDRADFDAWLARGLRFFGLDKEIQ